MQKRIYVAGPMTGYENYNWRMFEAATLFLRRNGWLVTTPTEIDEEIHATIVERNEAGDPVKVELSPTFDYEEVLAQDLAALGWCHAICLLPGWHKSKGAKRELAHALDNGLEVYTWEEMFYG